MTGRRAGARELPQEAGAIALTVTFVVLAALSVVLPLVLGATGVLLAGGRARTAADAAALAAMAGSPLVGGAGDPDRDGAAAVARANGAELVAVDADGWPLAVVVEVAIQPSGPLGAQLPALTVAAAARAVPPDREAAARAEPP